MAITIDELQVQIEANASNASSGIDALSASLNRLKSAVKGGSGLTTTTKQLQALSAAVAQLKMPGDKINQLVAALAPLQTIGKNNLGAAINQLKKIPEITNALANTDMGAFAAKIREVTTAILPLSTEMAKVSAGFSKLPANIQKAINANAKLTTSNHKAAKSYGILGTGISASLAKFSLAYVAVRRIAGVIGGWITESNAYVENLNLFTVAMGKYAGEAQAYAESVGEIMGIDPSMWMRQQGVFMTLATGFGVASEKAAVMSKNLTQLGYDLSSFFNISVEDAMQKLQSGFSGELEPLRRLGYDLSQAKLETIALGLGIRKNIADMNQAEKSQLRYYAMLTQVTTAQGDMARTLSAPANQLRIFQAQITQAARALGNILIPALNAVLPYAIAFLKVIRTVANEIANLFGYELPEIDYSGLRGISNAGEDATGVLDETTEAAQDLKKAMLGIDELNIISPLANTGVAGISTGGDLGFNLPEYDFLSGLTESRVNEIAEEMEEPFREILRLVGLIGLVMLGWKVATGVIDVITKLSSLSNGGKLAISVTLALTAAAIIFDFINSIANGTLDSTSVQAAIQAALGGAALSGFLVSIGVMSGGTAILFGVAAAIQLMFIGDIIANWDELKLDGARLLDAVKKLFSGDFEGSAETLWELFKSLVMMDTWPNKIARAIIGEETWNKVQETLKNMNGEDLRKAFDRWFDDNITKPWKSGWAAVVKWWNKEGLGKWWSDVKSWFTKEKWQRLWYGVGTAWSIGWTSIRKYWKDSGLSKLWKEHIAPWFTFEKWKSLWDDALGAWKAAWNEIIKWWNGSVLGALFGKIEIEVNKKAAGGGGARTFASGGYPATGELFIAREAGPEMVGSIGGKTAVANNDDIVKAVSQGVYEAVVSASSVQKSGGSEYNLYIDGKQVSASVTRRQNSGNRMYGRTLQKV